jgi:hypothetical protein
MVSVCRKYGRMKGMKTTLDLSAETLRQIKARAAQEGVPMREVVERGMRRYLAGSSAAKPFRLKTVVTSGKGKAETHSWTEIREMIYAGQGGER